MFYNPMLFSPGQPFNSVDWIFELKWDGFRCLCLKQDSKVSLRSKKGNSLTGRFPSIQKELATLSFDCILDGELIVFDKTGYSDFNALLKSTSRFQSQINFIVFDILNFEGNNLINTPIIERKALLKEILPVNGLLRYCDHVEDQGEAFFKLTQERCLEGIVAKKKNSIYRPGERTKNWLKIKNKDYVEKMRMSSRFKAPILK